jgi:hypothetical protein
MRRWTISWAALMVVAALVLAGCGSGSTSRGAEGITGSTTASEEPQALDLEEKGGKGKGNSASGNPGKGGDKGNHRGRPDTKLEGVVTAKSGACRNGTLTVAGTPVMVNGATKFDPNCAAVVVGANVKVEGQPLGNGQVLARKIQVIAGPAAPTPVPPGAVALAGALVELVGPATFGVTTTADGKFKFEDVPLGTYTLQATVQVGGVPTVCVLQTGIVVASTDNEVEGKLFTNPNPPTSCASLVLLNFEVENKLLPLAGATVQLVSGGTVLTAVTNGSGEFEFLNSPPGVYNLNLTAPLACPLATGINAVAQSNRVKGKLMKKVAAPATCADIVLQKLEVKQGS